MSTKGVPAQNGAPLPVSPRQGSMTVTNPTPETESPQDTAPVDDHVPVEDTAVDVENHEHESDPLAELARERDEYLDDLRRQRAEFENYRKRVANDSAVQRTNGRLDTIVALLEFADDLDRLAQAAREAANQDDDLVRAIGLLDSKWRHVLGGLQVERIDATEVTFDPTQHDAVSQIPAEDALDEPVVTEVMRTGYRSGDRVLRPAMVVVKQ